MIFKIKARDSADPATIIIIRPVFFLSCFGVCVFLSELATDSRIVVSDLKKKIVEKQFTLTSKETTLL